MTTSNCKHAECESRNPIGEKLAFCELYGEWRNVSLGDCFGNCDAQVETMPFEHKLRRILDERGENLNSMERGIGVARQTVYRVIRSKSVLAAIAYFVDMTVEDLIAGTEMEDVWYR